MTKMKSNFESKYVFLRLSTDGITRKVMLKDVSIINEGNSTTIDINLEPEQVAALLGKLDYDQKAKDQIGMLEMSLEDAKFALKLADAAADELASALTKSDDELDKYKTLNEVNLNVINSQKMNAYTLEDSIVTLNALLSGEESEWG